MSNGCLLFRIAILISVLCLSFCDYSFKPMELKLVVEPVKNDFEALVRESFPKSDNRQFFVNIEVPRLIDFFLYTGFFLCSCSSNCCKILS